MILIKSIIENRSLRIILLIALVIRLLVALPIFQDSGKMLQNDSPSYQKVASNLLAGNGYSNCPEEPYYKDVLRTPTYPFLVASTNIFIKDVRFLFVIQLLLDLLTLILIFKLGDHLFSKAAGLVASLFYGISIINVVMCGQVLAETSFVFLIVLSFYLLSKKKKYLLAGFVLGLAVLCKPIGLYLIFLYAGFILLDERRFRPILLILLPFAILVGGWMIRNKSITNCLTISSISSYSLFAYNANMVLAYKGDKPESILREERVNRLYESTNGELGDYSGSYDYMEPFAVGGKDVIINNLGLYTYLHLKNSVNSLIPGVHYVLEMWGKTEGERSTMDVLRKEGIFKATQYYFDGKWMSLGLMIPWIACWIAMLVAALLGGIKIIRKLNWEIIVLVILPGLYFLFISGPSAEPRFGALIAPYFCLLGGFYLGGLDRIKNWL